MAIIEVEAISKYYPKNRGARTLIGKGGFSDWFHGNKAEHFAALDNITLTVNAGEVLGIIGRNGSGKSTLLKIMAGVTLPSTGQVRVFGRVASLLELGAGFHPMLTGRENIYMNAGLLGMRHAQVDQVYDEIVAFSGIADFIDETVDTYSSGMYVRIAFSVAAHANPDIFLVDEVLAVGDAEFQRKCRRKIGELREQGKTIIFVSHDISLVNTICENVIILNKGQIIQRDTPQKTIMYYMRQVGMEKGVHTFRSGELEVIKCDGRLSLFHGQNEVSSPSGFRLQIKSLGQIHTSEEADWEITERNSDGCKAVGRMMRLPILLHWHLYFNEGSLNWHIAIECEHVITIDEINVMCCIPTVYTEWIYGDLTGDFPALLPSDLNWTIIVSPEKKADIAAALPDEASDLPPIVIHHNNDNSHFSLFWANTEYLDYSRLLCSNARFPTHENLFEAGNHDLLSMNINLNIPRRKVLSYVASDRTIQSGRISARFEHGQIRFLWDGEELTTYLHLYSSLLIQHLWNDSHNLHWRSVKSLDDGIQIIGESRRFHFLQRWHIKPVENGIHLAIDIITKEELNLQEYHVSILLPPEYSNWDTDLENGCFPEYQNGTTFWSHCNNSFTASRNICAEGTGMPSVAMLLDKNSPIARMTAVNTTKDENARVLQALFVSGQGRIHVPPGSFPCFSGVIKITDTTTR